jgi:6-phosphogluconate dehydrogenase
MGKSLALNALSKGIPLAVFNRDTPQETHIIPNFLKEVNTALCTGFTDLEAFCLELATPRKILLLVPAGQAVDAVIDQLLPILAPDDIIIDAGNSHFKDSQRRFGFLKTKGLHFVGLGVSGGQEGALRGPAFMPGGDKVIIDSLTELTAMAASFNGETCNAYMGSNGAGHYVKMIHNGIEYAEMQLLAEVYDVLKTSKYTALEIAAILEAWHATEVKSYLLGIMPTILRKMQDNVPLLDLIKDAAQGKGTGIWSSKNSLDYGEPATLITAAVNARFSSAKRDERINLSNLYAKKQTTPKIDLDILLKAYKAARIVNHLQGFTLISTVAKDQNWDTSLAAVAKNWRAGCIIKSTLVREFADQLSTENLENTSLFKTLFDDDWADLKSVNHFGIDANLPLPCFNASLTHLFAFTQKQSSANIIQAQRDYFGAHGYKRIDTDNNDIHHTNWTKP